ncbi:MAG: substrate-binding domain-containing protein [Victivallaceae bacterium]|jgi:LacI family transcriptional regulator
MKNVLPIFEFYISSMYHLLRGVSDYAGEHDWHLGIISTRFELPRRWSGDGILTHLTGSPQLIKFLHAHADIPIVSFNPPMSPRCDFPYALVSDDNEEIGRIAARYFLTLGDVHCCWYGGHLGRYDAFVAELAKNHRQTQTIVSPKKMHNLPWDEISYRLVAQLKKLPLPCAVFCENDSWARELLEAALTGGFRVPEEIAIMGVDNETLICNSSSIQLSSIDSRPRKVGYEGAALLDRLMAGEPFPDAPVLVPPVPLPIIRKSTDTMATGNPIVAKAVEFIRKNHTADISVADIARTVCISDSGLRKLMNRKIGTSPCRLLQDMRLETACRLLRETEMKIESVAAQSGFGEAQRLHEIFRHVLKTTPARFRLESKG